MTVISIDELRSIMPYATRERCEIFIDPLNETMAEFEIDANVARACMFLAQISHESGNLRYVRELANGDAYEGRADLGNTEPGDGRRFRGHGLIQLTGRANHQEYADYKQMTIEQVLEYLETSDGAANVAGWFWSTRGLNEIADAGDFRRTTKIINGGYTHYEERLAYYRRATKVLA